MLSPYSVLVWPTHCWMATAAKLDPVDCIDGLAQAGATPQNRAKHGHDQGGRGGERPATGPARPVLNRSGR